MPIKILVCAPTDVGCVVMASGAPEDSRKLLVRGCAQNGWRLSSARHVPASGEMIFFVAGPTARQFQDALRGDPAFDFSPCG